MTIPVPRLLWDYTSTTIKKIETSTTLVKYDEANEGFSDPSIGEAGETWREILKNLIDRELTKETDELVAISAIVEKFAPHFKCQYLAGLWKRHLLHDLTWTGVPMKS
ncbi:hypothetical protein G7Y89_g8524 [Cudoniella acicularis]|uniref:Uncharacterized protein n=1 Tax=Cudoniella acicularis TaxID=354080 RepID=A0A8H4W104_9HELO|nr:hypothetical protein G7Y89_g8524 [Cudoniella acicularis]